MFLAKLSYFPVDAFYSKNLDRPLLSFELDVSLQMRSTLFAHLLADYSIPTFYGTYGTN